MVWIRLYKPAQVDLKTEKVSTQTCLGFKHLKWENKGGNKPGKMSHLLGFCKIKQEEWHRNYSLRSLTNVTTVWA